MGEDVAPDVTQKPAAAVAKIKNESKIKGQQIVKRPPALAAPTTKKACSIKSINKPNQGLRNPTNATNVSRNVMKPSQKLPDYIRTEMEILRQLSRVNRDLRILLKPKCERAPNTTSPQKYYQAVRQSAGGVGQRVGGVNCKKCQNILTKAVAAKSKSVVVTKTKPPTSPGGVHSIPQAEARGMHKKQTEIRLETQQMDKSASKTNKRPLQRLVLYFKPKRKSDESKGAPQRKQPKDGNKIENQVKTESAIKCKPKMDTQKQVKPTQAKINEQNSKQQNKRAEKAVKELEKCKEKLKVKDVKKVIHTLRAVESRKLKQRNRDEATSGKLKETPTKKLPQSQQSAQVQMALSQDVKRKSTMKHKMMKLGLKCLRKEKGEKVVDDTRKVKQNENENENQKHTKPSTPPTPEATAIENVHHEIPAPVGQVKSALLAGKFGNCLRFFNSRNKVSVTEHTESTEESVLNYEMQQKKTQKKQNSKNSKNLAAYNGIVLTNLDTYPAYSYVNVKYMKNLKARKEKEAIEKRGILINAQNRKIHKDAHATPSTSSLEEYFHVLSERMAREQKEADERKPKQRHSRRGLYNNTSNLNYKRARQTIQRQYNWQRYWERQRFLESA